MTQNHTLNREICRALLEDAQERRHMQDVRKYEDLLRQATHDALRAA